MLSNRQVINMLKNTVFLIAMTCLISCGSSSESLSEDSDNTWTLKFVLKEKQGVQCCSLGIIMTLNGKMLI